MLWFWLKVASLIPGVYRGIIMVYWTKEIIDDDLQAANTPLETILGKLNRVFGEPKELSK
jgi:hypothetical protein